MTSASFPPNYAHPEEGSWKRYFTFNTDAKVIGIQYIVLAFFYFMIGGLLAMIIRGELITPAADLVDRTVYNGIYTMHGTIMLFLFIFPVLYQHFFWFYSHPAVYVIILPVFGIFSELFPVYSRKPLFGYVYVAVASFIIDFLGLIVWVHHIFPSGVAQWMRNFFMFSTMLIAVPTGVKVFAWLGTIWRGKLRLTTPMLFCLGGLFNFVFAGVTGVMLATVPVDIHVSNTYFVVGHFHYVIYGAAVMGIFAAIYHWFPKFTGRMPYEGLGKVHFLLTFVGANLNFLPMHPLGLMGMPRRVSSYDPEFAFWNVLASLGAFLLGVSIIPFLLNMLSSWVRGDKAPANPWNAIGLEWLLPSPPAKDNFGENVPTVIARPYGYGTGLPLVENQQAYEQALQEA